MTLVKWPPRKKPYRADCQHASRIEESIMGVNRRITSLDRRVDDINNKVSDIHTKLIGDGFSGAFGRIIRLEKTFDNVQKFKWIIIGGLITLAIGYIGHKYY